MKLKQVIFNIVLLLLASTAKAQTYSYIYLEGDKSMPFFVKANDMQVQRMGDRHYIISKLPRCYLNVLITFERNIFPPQKFVLEVPDNSSRALELVKKGKYFFLRDVKKDMYVPAGNSALDERLSNDNPGKDYIINEKIDTAATIALRMGVIAYTYNEPVNIDREDSPNPAVAKQTPAPQNEALNKVVDSVKRKMDKNEVITTNPQNVTTTTRTSVKKTTYTFNDPTLKKTVPKKEEPFSDTYDNQAEQNKKAATSVVKPPAPVAQSKCGTPMPDASFSQLYAASVATGDKARLKFLLSNLRNCFTTTQLKLLGKTLVSDPERYTFFKQAYPHTADPGNFNSLGTMITSKEWKDYFRLITQ